MKRKTGFFFSAIFFLLKVASGQHEVVDFPLSGRASGELAIMSYASNEEQVRSVKALIKSIRDLGGKDRNSQIYVVLIDSEHIPGDSLKGRNVELLTLDIDRSFLNHPLAVKAFAAAKVEEIAAGRVKTIVWFDPGVIVLNSFEALDLAPDFEAAVRPVTLANNIALSPDVEPNDYWAPIYREVGLDYRRLPAFKTIVDEMEIQPYFNCEVYSLDPGKGLCREWARILGKLLGDRNYQQTACTTFLRRLFLHQAVLSGVISSKIKPERIKPLPITSGYPFTQHEKLSAQKRISRLNEAAVVIFDQTWVNNPDWMKAIPIQDPLKTWLADTYRNYLELTENPRILSDGAADSTNSLSRARRLFRR